MFPGATNVQEIEGLNPKEWFRLTAEGPLELDEFLEWVLEVSAKVARFGFEVAERFMDRDFEPWQWEILLDAIGTCLDHFELMKAEARR